MMQTREMIAKLLTSAVFSLSLLASTLLIAAPHQSPNSSHDLDQQIEATMKSLASGNISETRVLSQQMSRTFPRYKLAHLLSAELEATAAFQDVRAAGFSWENMARYLRVISCGGPGGNLRASNSWRRKGRFEV